MIAGTGLEILRAIRLGAVRIKTRAILDAYRDAVRNAHLRQPVSAAAFRAFRRLSKQPTSLSSVVSQLGPSVALGLPSLTSAQSAGGALRGTRQYRTERP
jgi:hypothetical protein